MHSALWIALALSASLSAITPVHAGQESIIAELDANVAPVSVGLRAAKSVGDWRITHTAPQHCTATFHSWRGDNQAVRLDREKDQYWISFISDQRVRGSEPATTSFPVFRELERGGNFIEFVIAHVGEQRAYALRLDAKSREFFSGGKFFTLAANLGDEEEGTARGDTFMTVGLPQALAALHAC